MLLKTPDEEKAARLLDEARALLKKHGWHTGSMGEVGDSHCLIGALREAGGVEKTEFHDVEYDHDPILAMALAAMGFKGNPDTGETAVDSAIGWNDDLDDHSDCFEPPATSGKPTVLRRLRRAARKLREKLFA